jgi:hypothetical protein
MASMPWLHSQLKGTTPMKALLAASLVSATIGGTVGHFASVQKVQDVQAERQLRLIAVDKISVESKLAEVTAHLNEIKQENAGMKSDLYPICYASTQTKAFCQP